MKSHYTILIEWSDEDECFVASLPEWGRWCHTHGETYEDALEQARKVLDLLIDSTLEDGESLPAPQRVSPALWHGAERGQALQLA